MSDYAARMTVIVQLDGRTIYTVTADRHERTLLPDPEATYTWDIQGEEAASGVFADGLLPIARQLLYRTVEEDTDQQTWQTLLADLRSSRARARRLHE